jgi:hypothetical protein
VFSACKVIAMMLKSCGKSRISGVEAFEKVIKVIPVSICMLLI